MNPVEEASHEGYLAGLLRAPRCPYNALRQFDELKAWTTGYTTGTRRPAVSGDEFTKAMTRIREYRTRADQRHREHAHQSDPPQPP